MDSGTSRASLRVWLVLAFLALAMLSAGCGHTSSNPALRATIHAWFSAIHARDFVELARYDASAPLDREGAMFDAWRRAIEGIVAKHELDRDAGRIEPDDQGYRLVIASQVGRGAFWELVDREVVENGIAVTMRVTFGYGEINYLTLPRGSTVYLMGAPLGTIHRIPLGEGAQYTMDVLSTLDMRVHLVEPEETIDGDAPFKVASFTWVEGSETHETVHWIF